MMIEVPQPAGSPWEHVFTTYDTRTGAELEAAAKELAASLGKKWDDLNGETQRSYVEAAHENITPKNPIWKECPHSVICLTYVQCIAVVTMTAWKTWTTCDDSNQAAAVANRLQGEMPTWEVRAQRTALDTYYVEYRKPY